MKKPGSISQLQLWAFRYLPPAVSDRLDRVAIRTPSYWVYKSGCITLQLEFELILLRIDARCAVMAKAHYAGGAATASLSASAPSAKHQHNPLPVFYSTFSSAWAELGTCTAAS